MRKDFFIALDSLRFIVPLAILLVVAGYFGAYGIGLVLLLLLAFVIWFFRNPERVAPPQENALISPADGEVIKIEEVEENDLLKTKCQVVCIFMNVFNVHVNRNICSGVVKQIKYYPGKFLVASLDKASSLNERNAVLIEREDGARFVVVQIAGLIARRIACWVREGDAVKKGERYGLIRFGSRLDVYLPLETKIPLKVGDKVSAGVTIIGVL
ncbi:MAG: phosphatidylserine decarboxylase family protein [Deltaproteobacteria bacterium]|nr:phosphatidylserine decarboxylase family protein [Deltaproteobacteria bacterium]